MSHLSKKVLGTGAAMVALSAFVPNLNVTDKLADLNLTLIPQAHAQATKTATLKFSATVINPLSISNKTAVKFGKFAVGGTGKVVVKSTGGTSSNGQVIITKGANGVLKFGAPKSASFSLSLTKFAAGNIFLTNGTGGGTGGDASKTMTVTQVKIKAATTGKMAAKTGTFANGTPVVGGFKITDTGKVGTAKVGGTLVIDGTELPGTYTGSTVVKMSL